MDAARPASSHTEPAMTDSRRDFLRRSAFLPLGLGLGACRSGSSRSQAAPAATKPWFRVSLAEWSLHRTLRAGEITNLDFPGHARREFGIEAVEYVNSFFKEEARNTAYLDELNQRCADAGVESLLIMCDGEGHLADADQARRARAIENHHKWIEAAAHLGCHAIRVNAGGSGAREDMMKRAADSLVALAEYGRPHGVAVIVENHGGPSSDGAWLAGVMRLADDPAVGTLPDFGNFRVSEEVEYDRYRGVEELMPFAKAVSAKSHDFDGNGDCVQTDYRRMLSIVKDAGYRGWIGVEYEGGGVPEAEGIRLTKDLLLRVRDELS